MEPDSVAAKTARGSIELIVQGMANTFLGLLFFIVLARTISKAEMGVYAALNVSYTSFQIIGSLGLNFAIKILGLVDSADILILRRFSRRVYLSL